MIVASSCSVVASISPMIIDCPEINNDTTGAGKKMDEREILFYSFIHSKDCMYDKIYRNRQPLKQ